ncbi:hypothetical protein [Bifidobacterium callimiconis]|uniref:Uncharacterized protein n=1 Tax=Bifidobacterium callimiconis TaxID=2306973 RepID=A0A430FAY8_9BIFI|nr:hypothetical protein [Bifidobacterium callimiconis]MBT1176975.1 hypothetical protein [Bifidobacterium callimiconis]RSX50000.1 hypothetical protein D2E23_1954 [Bifidobacterium callimiconis]
MTMKKPNDHARRGWIRVAVIWVALIVGIIVFLTTDFLWLTFSLLTIAAAAGLFGFPGIKHD